MPDPRPAQGGYVRLRAFQILHHHNDMARQHFPRSGQNHAAGTPFEQRHADLVFELQDLSVHGGGGDVELPRGFANRARAAHSVKIQDGGGVYPHGVTFAGLVSRGIAKTGRRERGG